MVIGRSVRLVRTVDRRPENTHMADALTDRQREILTFISASIAERGYPPTLREIGEHFGIRSTNGVNDHLKALEKKGHLRREDLKSRAMRPTSTASTRTIRPGPSLASARSPGSIRSRLSFGFILV